LAVTLAVAALALVVFGALECPSIFCWHNTDGEYAVSDLGERSESEVRSKWPNLTLIKLRGRKVVYVKIQPQQRVEHNRYKIHYTSLNSLVFDSKYIELEFDGIEQCGMTYDISSCFKICAIKKQRIFAEQ